MKNVNVVKNNLKLLKLTASPSFDSFRIFSEVLAAVNMKKTKLYLNRPIHVEFAILDLLKVFMHQIHYACMKRKCGPTAKLLFTETDSLCYDVKTEDIYQVMSQDANLFDTSEYDQDHALYSTANKKVLEKMKDETHTIPIGKFVGVRPKMYSIMYTEKNKQMQKKTDKGIKKSATKRQILHASYNECMFEKKDTMASMNQIFGENHRIYSNKLNKIGLRPYDEKRYILDDG